ncbi:MAG: adenylate/guanylate cyclase domain-containing protein [Gallionellaceae bacterium]
MSDTSHQEKLAILFADVSGSTSLYEKLGDVEALRIINNCLNVLIRELPSRHGVVIKTIGDEIMCTFPSPTDALEAACAMQLAVDKERPGGIRPIYIRIGFHYGEVICEGNDIFGDAVNVAARVTSITRARQILTTHAAVNALPAKLRNKVRQITRAEFRGKDEAMDVFQVSWEQDDTMTTRIGLPQFRKPSEARHELLLRFHQHLTTINEQHKSIVVGRGENCDLIIPSTFASRQHARIEFSFGKFVLADHSANGTYVRFSDNQVIHVMNQEVMLHGTGVISLGQPFGDGPVELIDFLIQ